MTSSKPPHNIINSIIIQIVKEGGRNEEMREHVLEKSGDEDFEMD